MANFEYKPISLEGPSFRLLRLLKGHGNSIHCRLFESKLPTFEHTSASLEYTSTSLEHSSALPEYTSTSPERMCDYAALSYTWGAEKTPCDIVINESKIRVTKNVYLALRDLYHQGKDLVLWVDALCIDQNNNDERGQQVQQMGSIYNKAKRVIIWLGEATYDTDYIMDHMKQLEEGLKHTSNSQEISCIWSKVVCNLRPDQKDLLVEGLQLLLHRSWFKRVWIIQETGNARAADIICGSKSVSASIFACMPSLLGITLDLHCQSIIDIMPGPFRDSSWWAKRRDLYTMLSKFRNSEATKPQDRIFALLGISLDVYSTNILKADYGKDIQDIVFDTISFLLNFSALNIYRFFDWRVLDLFEKLDILATEVLKCAMNTSHEWAIQERHGTVVKLLLEQGAELETKSKDGQTALSWASENGHEAVVKLLLEQGAELEPKYKDDQTPLSRASGNGHEAIVKLLLEKGAKFELRHHYGQMPLLLASENGHETVVKLLLEKGAKLKTADVHGRTPIKLASMRGHEAIVKLLLEKGAELETDYGQTPLLLASGNGREAVVKLLLEKGAKLETTYHDGQTPLSRASGNGHEAVVKLLLEKGAELETKSKDGQTPLSWASGNGYEAVVKLLLQKGAELETKSKDGQTPLSWASGNGHEAVVKLLLEKGAELEAKSKDGQTPLSRASGNGHEAVVKLLHEKGAKLETTDDDS